MKYFSAKGGRVAKVELSRRNLEALLAKLDDPLSNRTLMKQEEKEDGDDFIVVQAVEDSEHYENRAPGTIYMPSSNSYH